MKEERNLFAGDIPANYDQYLGPFLFEPKAVQVIKYIDTTGVKDVLEIACGTGRVTKHLAKLFGKNAHIVATDFSAQMIDVARNSLQDNDIEFMQADMQDLPFADNSFDLVICQFGIMFPPDKPKALKEIFRVLRKGGVFIFSTWDSLENNHATAIVDKAVINYFKDAAPSFFQLPHSMFKTEVLENLMKDAGFSNCVVEKVSIESESPSAQHIAKGFVFGTPMYAELIKLDVSSPPVIAQSATEMLVEEYGKGIVKAGISALFCKCTK